jgi:hypothetical protein
LRDEVAILVDLPFIQIRDSVNSIDIKSLYICSLSEAVGSPNYFFKTNLKWLAKVC